MYTEFDSQDNVDLFFVNYQSSYVRNSSAYLAASPIDYDSGIELDDEYEYSL